jgi:hypothetical protein
MSSPALLAQAAMSAADKQGQNLAGVLPALPPTEALAHLLSIFFAIFGDINDGTTGALIKLNEVTTQIPFPAVTRRSDRFLRVDDRAFKQNPGANGPPAVHNYYMHVDFEAGNLANPRTWSALCSGCASR